MPVTDNMSRITLYSATNSKATLDQAVEAAREVQDIEFALVYSQHACRLVRLEGMDPQDLRAAYEARLFGPRAEVRWVEGGGAVLYGEACNAPNGWVPRSERKGAGARDGTYVLAPRGLEMARAICQDVGNPDVRQMSAVVHVREYLDVIDVFGNVGLIAERLIGLGVQNVEQESQR